MLLPIRSVHLRRTISKRQQSSPPYPKTGYSRILRKAKAKQHQNAEGQQEPTQSNKKNFAWQPNKPAAKAGRTSVAHLGQSNPDDNEDTDYSGSEIGVVTHQAVCSLSSIVNPQAVGNLNLDSGCSMTMLPNVLSLVQLRGDNIPVQLADQSTVEATHRGLISLPLSLKTEVKALVVPFLHKPLLSMAGLCDRDLHAVFTKDGCNILAKRDGASPSLIGRGYRRGNLYYLPAEPVSSFSTSLSLNPPIDNSLLAWHIRLAHTGLRSLKHLLWANNITPLVSNEIEVQQCPTCVQCKMSRRVFKSRQPHRLTTPGELIHSDVGSYKVVSREGYKYFITFIDDFSKACYVYPMKYKNESFKCFKIFRAFFEKSKSHIIQALRTDNGGKYLSTEFTNYLQCLGIAHEPGPPHSPQLNGVAERANQTIGNLVRCALLQAKTPKLFWADAL
ncbi:hypothetical protein PCANC_07764 [Puccinia coronata f. sp. avenae]|uniref:Integrase catalytic domain-containing protein n=1 Tax=Puccinia coronata f. sp. avenae TaxID=200324 RepID=A0A2N5VHA8_9BASI|nr:hypothetical protein PCANC_07764 [Puccinia coronata f. sp. avenae]